jgi:hypothetical protein
VLPARPPPQSEIPFDEVKGQTDWPDMDQTAGTGDEAWQSTRNGAQATGSPWEETTNLLLAIVLPNQKNLYQKHASEYIVLYRSASN